MGTDGLFVFAVDATPEVNRSAPTAGTGDDQFQDDYLPLDGGDFFDPMEMDVEKNRSAPTGEGAQEVRVQLAGLCFKQYSWRAHILKHASGMPCLLFFKWCALSVDRTWAVPSVWTEYIVPSSCTV
jgi:hypothetical protein